MGPTPKLPRESLATICAGESSCAGESLRAGESGVRLPSNPGQEVTGIQLDSRLVQPGDLFAALPGHLTHGASFARQAIERGAVAILTDAEGVGFLSETEVPVVVLDNPRARLGWIAARLFGTNANGALPLMIGITGTNGKTTVAHLVDAGLRAAGLSTGLVGTLGVRVGSEEWATGRTTPEAPHLHAILSGMRQAGVDAVTMEVSSHALVEGRVNGLRFTVAGFTQLSQDHLDYHGSMEDYFAAKSLLFSPELADAGVVGVDDTWGRRLAQSASIPMWTWSTTGEQADWHLGTLTNRESEQGVGFGHQNLVILGPSGHHQVIRHRLPGDFNKANVICAYAILMRAGVTGEQAAKGISSVSVPGRMEVVDPDVGIIGVVDYAHTPDAIERVVSSVRRWIKGRIIVVVGAGGDRDREKRPLMGEAAARLSDYVIVTDDNPRSEDAALIRATVVDGAVQFVGAGRAAGTRVFDIGDRRQAIAAAVGLANEGDVVLVLGKGHEQGQEQAGVMTAFDDRVELRSALLALSAPAARDDRGAQ